ncbi:hypothetical protein [Hyalangium rubrum]|uniref:Pentapeptide repeat-containing protein n=1 Tax=Hyalangium rubrum TaxID=3103134 RepID=A0ABU5HGV4_9BACT|nr:hypothetical protein [Hyalangium sp. s54d21]MDY7232062.1 hypothetical protein [Hyalangium sp. s54d21]
MWLNNIIFENREIERERLVLGDEDGLYYLGPKLTLRSCTLVLSVPAKRMIISGARFIDCAIEVKQELKNFRWHKGFLKGCRFTGRIKGNVFGIPTDGSQDAGIEDCDFTGAHLDQCSFLGCDVRTLRFPSWPCFTIFDPVRRWRELSALQWPGDIGPVVVEGFAEGPLTEVAVTYSAPDLAKRSGTTPEAIRAVLEKLDGVKF